MPVTVVDAVLHPSDAAQSFVYCKSPIGLLEIGAAPAAVTSVSFVEKQRREPAGTPLLNEAVSQVSAYFQGTLRTFDLPIALNGTEFQCAVWRQLLKIGYGRTAAYRDIAAGIGRPTAVRAVGGANGRNPLTLIVPCHRIIGSDGSLTGYGSGLWRKRWLLAHESTK